MSRKQARETNEYFHYVAMFGTTPVLNGQGATDRRDTAEGLTHGVLPGSKHNKAPIIFLIRAMHGVNAVRFHSVSCGIGPDAEELSDFLEQDFKKLDTRGNEVKGKLNELIIERASSLGLELKDIQEQFPVAYGWIVSLMNNPDSFRVCDFQNAQTFMNARDFHFIVRFFGVSEFA